MGNRKSLNTIAKKDDLELVKGNGYFYWWGLTKEMELKCAGMYTTSVYVYRFSDLSFERWLDELRIFKEQLAKADNEEKEYTNFTQK